MNKKIISLLTVILLMAINVFSVSAAIDGYTGTPYGGTAPTLTATSALTIEAEKFDEGGADVAYFISGTYSDESYRNRQIASFKGFSLRAGEWFNYTVNAEAAGYYKVLVNAVANSETRMNIYANGKKYVNDVKLSKYNPANDYLPADNYMGYIYLNEGENLIKLEDSNPTGSWMYINNFKLCDYGTSAPYKSNIITADTTNTIQFENYDIGGQNNAYYDAAEVPKLNTNTNGRTDEYVSISNLSGGLAVSFDTNEWLKYTLEVKDAGTYALDLNAYLPTVRPIGFITVTVNGTDVVSNKSFNNKSTSENYIPLLYEDIAYLILKEGKNTVVIKNTAGYYYPDYFTLTKLTAPVAYTDKVYNGTDTFKMYAKEFDYGGQGIAYNTSATTPATSVRIGEYVGFAALANQPISTGNGNWYKYTFNSSSNAAVNFKLKAAAIKGNPVVNIYVNDVLALEGKSLILNDEGVYTIRENDLGIITLNEGANSVKIERVDGYSMYIESFELTPAQITDSVSIKEVNGTITASATLTNDGTMLGEATTGYLIIATYKGSQIDNIDIKEMSAEFDFVNGTGYDTETLTLALTSGVTHAKAFLWTEIPSVSLMLTDTVEFSSEE